MERTSATPTGFFRKPHLAVGDTIWVTPEGYPANLVFQVATVEPERYLVLAATDDPESRTIPKDVGWIWSFQLVDIVGETTRSIWPNRQTTEDAVASAIDKATVAPIGFVMERKTLMGIKARAGGANSNDAMFFVFLSTAGVLIVAFAATPFSPRSVRLVAVV